MDLSNKPRRSLSVFVLAMFSVSIMASLRNLPLVAHYGLSAIFYFILIAILFLIPAALVSAELATGWSKEGGIYIWVKEALGDRWGFFAIWMQWIHNMSWYPVILSFVASSLAFTICPSVAENKHFVFIAILIAFWGMTLLNYLGIRVTSLFSTIGVIAGTIIPGCMLILLALIWILSGHHSQIAFSWKEMIPAWKGFDNLSFLAGLFLAFTGLEVSASLAANVKNPQKSYPKAILLAAIITFFVFMLGSLSISIVLPQDEIRLVTGLVETFHLFLEAYNLSWVAPILSILLVFGALAETNAWISSPVKGLHATSVHGDLPPFFQHTNSRGAPTNLLLFQAIIVSLCTIVFLYMPNISGSFWILSVLSAQSYIIMYIFMFISALRLRYTKPHVPRAYKIPYHYPGMWLFSSLGILSSVITFSIGFFPPDPLFAGEHTFYLSFLIIGLIIMCAMPLAIYACKKPHWTPQ